MSYPSPVADWYPDPVEPGTARWWDGAAWTTHRRPIARRGPALDRAQAELRERSPQPWGWQPVVLSLGALVGLIVVGLIASATIDPHGTTARTAYAVTANVVVEVLLALAVWRAGREVAARNGGWAVAFGLRRPRWSDAKWVAAGIGITFLARGIVVAVANGLTHGRAAHEAENLRVHHVDAVTVVLLIGVAVIAAPFIEELVFRGLLLRTFVRRMPFWPAAALSTLIFAALHTYEVSTLVGALTLAASVGCLGLVNCWLNRRTDSLAPGMIVHASFNLLAVIVLVAQAH
jgi:membrane protease YdiL (CAAX protease family)